MAQTLFSAYFHIVFSTKNRYGFILPEIEEELYAYIGGIVRGFDARLLGADGTSNHAHLLTSVSKNYLLPDMIGAVKRDSSKWIKTLGEGMLKKFAWQDGYSRLVLGTHNSPR